MRGRVKTKNRVKLAPPNAYCWHPESGLARLSGFPPDGPYAIFDDRERGDWYVWWSDGAEHIVSRKPTKEEIGTELRRLADEWRERSTRKVYFIGSACAIGANVKIGIAYEPKKRLNNLQTASHEPLRLLATMIGDKPDEARLHRKFRRSRLSGEWFRITPALKRLIEGCAQRSSVR